jgi:hypothetical protein
MSQTEKTFAWTCPFCNHDSIVSQANFHSSSTVLNIDNIHGWRMAFFRFIVCPNKECRQFTFTASLYEVTTTPHGDWAPTKLVKTWNLIPASQAKVFPPYVPKPILDDYEEACLIRDLSPKASATLSRRCLQGMIRDFWGVTKARLIDEIEAIKDKVDPLTWKAIDAVRGIGNIGAHMEKDINFIIDVDPNEASQLINLIEILIKDWYIIKHEREKSLQSVVELGKAKDSQKKGDEETPKSEPD